MNQVKFNQLHFWREVSAESGGTQYGNMFK